MVSKSVCSPVLFIVLYVLAAGCRPPGSPVRRRVPGPDLTRHTMTLDRAQLDALRGRTIVVDPGHGGKFAGAKSPKGIREADVNLDVALQVWALLESAGANSVLTRVADETVARGKNVSVRDDLEARADMARQIDADMFISLHHNADIHRDTVLNDLKVYYKMNDEGASFDIAQALVQKLAIAPTPDVDRQKLVLPGNFRVLRESPCPAVLTETSYMTAPQNEPLLAEPAYRREEAYAIVAGLADYFARGFPSVEWLSPPDATLEPGDVLIARLDTADTLAVDADTIRLNVDGQVVPHMFDRSSRLVTAAVPLVQRGDHTAEIAYRNTAGNAAVQRQYPFHVETVPRHLVLHTVPASLPPEGKGFLRVTVRALDDHMLPTGDGERVVLRSRTDRIEPETVVIDGGEAVAHCWVAPESDQCDISARLGEIETHVAVVRRTDARRALYGRVVDAENDEPIAAAAVVADLDAADTTDSRGYFVIDTPAVHAIRVSARGYAPAVVPVESTEDSESSYLTVKLEPIAFRRLAGVRVAVDPQYGGDWHGLISPTGVRAADINLRVAELLSSYLDAAGARVVMARRGNSTVPPLSRVGLANGFEADLYIEIGHGTPPDHDVAVLDNTGHLITDDLSRTPYVAAYPSSTQGNRLATILAGYLAPLVGPADVRVVGSSSTTLTHTACPAIMVHVGEPCDQATTRWLTDTAVQREEAYAMFTAITEWAGVLPNSCGDIRGCVTRNGGPVAGRLVTLDRWLNLQTDLSGMYTFRLVPPGPHEVALLGDNGTEHVRRVRVRAKRLARADFSLAAVEDDRERNDEPVQP